MPRPLDADALVVGGGLAGLVATAELLAAGKTVIQAAKEMGMETKRARLIARENDIKFQGPP